jgi:hypothetical protein
VSDENPTYRGALEEAQQQKRSVRSQRSNHGDYGREQTQQHSRKMYNKVFTIVSLRKARLRGPFGTAACDFFEQKPCLSI